MTARQTHWPRGVLIYGVGSVGRGVARLCARHGVPVVAAVNRPGGKVGRSLAELTGCPEHAAILVRASLEEALADADADIAVVAVADRLAESLEDHLACLGRGLDVVSSGCETALPSSVSADYAAALHEAALANGVTCLGTGFQDAYRVWLPAAAAGASTGVTAIVHRSVVDIGRHGPAVAVLAGAGLDPAEFLPAITHGDPHYLPIYRIFAELLVDTLGWRARSAHHVIEPVLHDGPAPRREAGLTIAPGQTIGARYRTEIVAEGGARLCAVNELRLLLAGEEEHLEWEIAGTAPARLRLSGLDSEAATATQIVNRLPDVLAAPPGLITLGDLGPPRPLPPQPSRT